MKKETITQSGLKDMGWTMTLIKKYLPEPMLEINPHYRNAPKMKLWYMDDVKEAMLQDSFQEDMKKAAQRKAIAAKAVETKKKNLDIEMQEILNKITVIVLSSDKLQNRTLKAKQAWYDEINEYRNYSDYYPLSINGVDECTLRRWEVNYIRHNLVSYDEGLEYMRGKVGRYDEYPKFKNAILQKIAEAYPDLAEECENQMEMI